MSLKRDVWEATHRICDKCHRWVPPENDMALVMAATGIPGSEWIPAIWHSRHFLPVLEDDGTVLCEGSPSRAQYIEGQPRDTRGYRYDERLEPLYRSAWRKLQAAKGR